MRLFSDEMLLKTAMNYSQKILLIVTGAFCCRKVDLAHGFMLVCVIGGFFSNSRNTQKKILNVIAVMVAVLVLSKMTAETRFLPSMLSHGDCNANQDPMQFLPSPELAWFGFESQALSSFGGYFFGLFLATLFRAIDFYSMSDEDDETEFTIFPKISRDDLDKTVVGAIKYMVNFGFFKFGVEICKTALAAMIITRDDVFTVIYGIALLLISTLSRSNLKRVWWLLQACVTFCIIYQYIMALGSLPTFCLDIFRSMDRRLRMWLFLPHRSEITSLSIGDIIVLFLLCEQQKIFQNEQNHPAGSNEEIFQFFGDGYQNPIHDHTTYCRHGIDYFKSLVFAFLYWGSLIASFAIGGTRSDLLSLIYLINGLVIIWQDSDLALWSINRLRKWWNTFLIYSVLCLIVQTASAELICFAEDGSYYHWIWRFTTGAVCGKQPTEYWDLAGFAFLLFQRRFIESNYFLHHVNDTKAMIALESWGATLFANISREKMERDEKERAQTVNRIKADMALIKEHNKRINVMEPSTHDDAILNGDYFMFEETGRPGDTTKIGQSFLEGLNLKRRKSSDKNESMKLPFSDADDCDVNKRKQVKPPTPRLFQLYKMAKHLLTHSLHIVIQFLNQLSHEFHVIAWAMKIEKTKLKASGSFTHDDIDAANSFKISDFKEWEEEKNVNIFIQLMNSAWFVLLDYSELACYLAVLVLQGSCPTLLSLPIPLMLFLWGALTVRHPSPTFWTTLIAYIEVIMIFKALFKNDIFPWMKSITDDGEYTIYSPDVIGVTEVTFADVFLLVLLFIHRKKLKSFGLWSNQTNEPIPTTTSFIIDRSPGANQSLSEYCTPVFGFIQKLREKSSRLPVDFYTCSFICEFLALIIIFVGFSSFVPHVRGDDQVFYLAENDVPVSYLIALILQFVVIIIDRVLYLRKNIVGKLIMHFFLVILSHIWLFVVLPIATQRSYRDSLWPQLWYTVKFISFLLSAYQLRNGYPMRVQSYFLARVHNYFSLYLFRVLKFTPYFFPLRHIIGWACTKTSLTLYEWYLQESMYAVIYETKCNREISRKYPSPRGEAYPTNLKYINGGLVLLGFCLLIWAPLILFAFFKSVAVPDPPTEARISFQINNYQTLYSAELREGEILPLSQRDFQQLHALGKAHPKSFYYLQQYDYRDIAVVTLNKISSTSWNISPPTVAQIKLDASSNKEFVLNLHMEFHRRENGIPHESSFGDFSFPLDTKTAKTFIDVFDTKNKFFFRFTTRLPLYLESKKGIISSIGFNEGSLLYQNVSLSLNTSTSWWWGLTQWCEPIRLMANSRTDSGGVECDNVHFYVLSSKRIPGFFQFFTTKGIIGVYASVVIVIWGIIRTATSQMFLFVRYYALPNVDAGYQLCNDIYLARESREFALEEDLFAKLLFLFRSPETLVKWTKQQDAHVKIV